MITRKTKVTLSVLTLAVAGALSGAQAVAATTLSFSCITNNNASNCGAGASQLSMDVVDLGGNQVRFDVKNDGPAQSVVTEVYFDDGTLLGIAGLIDKDQGVGGHTLVDFTQGANPPNLPGANNISPAFQVTAGFLADADSPGPKWGVNNTGNEWLGIIFDLKPGMTYANVVSALAQGGGDGGLRVGYHVTGFGNGGSESFVNDLFAVPVPAAVWLLGSALVGLGLTARRTKTA